MHKSKNKKRLAYFVSHPIQYQAPLLKLIAEQSDIELTVFFLSDISIKAHSDKGFGVTVDWGIPLLDGYRYEFLESKCNDQDFHLNNPWVALSSVKSALASQKWDAIWVHGYNNFALLYVLLVCRIKNIPLLFRGDSTLVCSRKNRLKTIFIRSLVKQCHALLYVGTDNREYYEAYGATRKQLFSMPYAVDNKYFKAPVIIPKEALCVKAPEKTVILYASKFIARKNPLLLVEAFNNLDDKLKQGAELWLVGDGEQRNELYEAVKKYRLQDSVKLLGFKNQTELPWYFSQCDVFVLPSEKEPFGLVINEVMNQAKAIITTNEVGAARDLVHHKKNGWVVSANSLTELTQALDEALSDPQQLVKMGQHSLATIDNWDYQAGLVGLRLALWSLP